MPLIHSNTTAKTSVDYSLILIVMWSTIHKLRKTELSKKTKMIHKKKRNSVEQNFVWYFKNVKNYIKWHGMGFLWRPVWICRDVPIIMLGWLNLFMITVETSTTRLKSHHNCYLFLLDITKTLVVIILIINVSPGEIVMVICQFVLNWIKECYVRNQSTESGLVNS